MDADSESTREELDAFEATDKWARGEAALSASLSYLRIELVTLGDCLCDAIAAV